ncbi:putative transcription factor C2H2 family [Dioscorea sansibarensis]
MEHLEDFGQRVDLTRRIREVLVNYPEGTTVLKELIQNADDAGATKVRLCLDRRTHGTETLLSDSLAQWQGPALLAYNDAVFSEDDFVSISRIGGSKKQGQAWKTGRFGFGQVGFNSVYHITDLPSFVSDKYVVIFDPQGEYLPNVAAANPGKRLNYVSSSALSHFKDQFVPYCAFGCDMKSPFSGTLFRFPLRSANQAAVSKLSRQAYLEDDICSMFDQLYKEAVFTLLFLKNIVSIEMYIWEAGENEPQKVYTWSINSINEKTMWHRQALQRFSSSAECSNWQMDCFSLDILSEAVMGTTVERRMDTFFLVQGMAPTSSQIGAFATAAAKQYDLQLLPWASHDVLKQGQAFCFLPLPVRTGLAVQVNGFFEVSSNRRSIWYGADMDRGGKLRSDWNRLLLEDIVAPVFNELLLGLRNILGPSKLYYSFWPNGSFEEPWSILVEQIYRIVCSTPVCHSNSEGGKWISPSEAFIHDEEFCKNNHLCEALVLLGMPIVHLPKLLVEMFFQYCTHLKQRLVNPVTVRHFLKKCDTLFVLRRSHKLVLLEYCLNDLSNVCDHIEGLPLLPLANGEFGAFSVSSMGLSYFLCNEMEYKLLSQVPDRIIDGDIPTNLYNRLSEIASQGKTNITLLDGQSLLQLFPRFFPVQWKLKFRVAWNPESEVTHPTRTWFVLFWQYLRDQCHDLSIYSEWPILPSTSGYLYSALESSKLINAEQLSAIMNELLLKIGCKVLNPKYGVEHRELLLYVYDGDATGVLNSIFDTVSSDVNQLPLLFQELSVDEKNELHSFLLNSDWYYGRNISDIHIKMCKRLPIHRVHCGQSDVIQFSDLQISRKYLPPVGIPDHLLDGEFLFCTSTSEEAILVKFYGIEHMQKTTFYRQKILNRLGELQPQVRDGVMLSILQDLPQLAVEDSSFKEYLRIIEFVPTNNGSLESPQSLYDPRVEELYALLEESDYFPCDLFQEEHILDMLLLLGLRTSVSADTIIQSARQIESLIQKDQSKAYSRGKVLLSYLEVNAPKWSCNPLNAGQRLVSTMLSKVARRCHDTPLEADLHRFWNDLKMICWCPVLVDAPHPSLPWPSVSSLVAPPKLVRQCGDMWLVSASTRLLAGECSSCLSVSLGWSSPPGGSILAAQLLELGKDNEIVTDQLFRQDLALEMPRIYNLLSNLIGSDEMDIVKAVLEGCRWIWVGDGFATVSEVVLNGHLHLAPYMRVIPADLAVFKALFLELGVKEYLKPIDYANILSRMAVRKALNPLDGEEIRAAVLVVQHLAEVQFQDLPAKIYLPDTSCRLFLATDLVFNDAPWLFDIGEHASRDIPNSALNSATIVHKFAHSNISNDVAERLGVRSLRRLLLAESSDSMHLSLSGVAEAFGQHEALTTRLKHIVEMYADGPGILFELVQNAEDARASEVVFLLDKTHYGTSSILSPEMAEWQGPALYCFNNSVFSSQDLYAISRIGQDSKLEKPFSIGRFGLGFNCVYHFTDIPGFVSGENIVIFDPHANYLPGISPSHPGLRIQFVGRRILEQFPDQFTPFLHFGCNLQHPFPGTLFRFPLRNEVTASRSQIKQERYTPGDVEALFSCFSEVVSEALLFLRNVKCISIFVKDGSGHDMQLVHRVSRKKVVGLQPEPHSLHPMLNFVHGNQQSGMDRDQFLDKLSKTVDKDLPWNCQKVAVVEHSPLYRRTHFWVISECIGGAKAKTQAIKLGKRYKNFVPWASVAAYLHSVDSKNVEEVCNNMSDEEEIDINQFQLPVESVFDRKEFEGRAFCFLPLPINTRLPAHVNAHFELSSNRRDIWFGNDMAGGGRIRSECNVCLLEDVIAPAYGHLLAVLAEEIGPRDLFFNLWPTDVKLEPWASMVRKLYLSIIDLQFPVLYTKARGGKWITTRQAIFPDFNFPKVTELAETLSEVGLPVVCVSKQVVDRFMEACPSLHFLSPNLLRSLLIRRKREFKSKTAILMALEYSLSDMNGTKCSANLQGLPLIPLANGLFTTFSKQGEGDRIFVASQKEYDLLKDSIPHLLLDCCIPDEIFKKLHDLARSGESNLSPLTCHALAEILPRILPIEWQYARQVSWSPGHLGQPSWEWMSLLWSYLKESCTELSMFSNWPILPVGNDCLVQLVENSNVIRDDGWSENMISLLRKLGCFFLRSDLPIDHPQLKKYVQDATASGVLNAVGAVAHQVHDIDKLFMNASRGELHELRSFIFQSRWFSGGQINSRHASIIKILPIFESYGTRELSKLGNSTKWLKPVGVNDDLLDGNFIQTESEREKSILKGYLGIHELSKAEFYKDYVLNRMSDFLSHSNLLSAILLDVKLLIEDDPAIRNALSETTFVLTAQGSWQHPSRLYDPRVPGFQDLLHKEASFPCDKFLNAEILETLVSLGLRRTLGFAGLLDSARSISMMHESGNMDAITYGQKLLAYMNALGCKLDSEKNRQRTTSMLPENDYGSQDVHLQSENHEFKPCAYDQDLVSCLSDFSYDMPENEFWLKIRTIAWCPVSIAPPVEGVPWFTSDHRIAPPNITRPKSQMWTVSSKMRILDGECCSNYLQCKLGWMDSPNVGVLCTQLVELSKSYRQLKLLSVQEPVIYSAVEREIPQIYSKLQKLIGTNDFKDLKEALKGIPWVWVGDNFVLAEALAFDSPVKYHPYLYVVPSELSEFRVLLLELGVKLTLDTSDYVHILWRLQHDLKGEQLTAEQLNFVHCILEAFAEASSEINASDAVLNSILIPDLSGVLRCTLDLVYNDAPWMDNGKPADKYFVHPCISDDLAKKLGVQSLCCLSLVDEKLARDLPCMDYARICELLTMYGGNEFLLFDLLELADCCKAKKVHFIYDKREHPRQSLLQHNFGEFQGSSLTVVLEGATLSMEEICGFQHSPPWKIQGNALNYGLGLVSSYFICDFLTIISSGYFYMFDPLGLALAAPSIAGPSAKSFSLLGTDLTRRFHDQFIPMIIDKETQLASSDSTVIRMPLSAKFMNELETGGNRLTKIFDSLIHQASSTLLFLKSILQVSISSWEKGNLQPSLDFSVSIDPSFAIMRNPFSEKKWRKFQIARLFSSSSAAIKTHVIDIHVSRSGSNTMDKWLVVLCLGSGQTRNMALDKQYLAYNLTPVAGIAACISQNGQPISAHLSSCMLSPLPLSGNISTPVTVLGCFLVCHNGGRYLFTSARAVGFQKQQSHSKNQLIETWNKELLLCVRDSYIEMVMEFQKLKKDPLTSNIESNSARLVSYILRAYGDKIYSFWPRSKKRSVFPVKVEDSAHDSNLFKATEANWESLIEQVIRPFYARLVDLPVWQLYSGNVVRADEGMFLSQPGNGEDDDFPPAEVCNFIKEHYPVFSVPSELVSEIQAVGVKVREIKPKMVRDLLKVSSSLLVRFVDAYVDVLDYCLSDIHLQHSSEHLKSITMGEARTSYALESMHSQNLSSSIISTTSSGSNTRKSNHSGAQSTASSGVDTLEIVSNLGRALYDFGRGVVEDISMAGGLQPQKTVGASSTSGADQSFLLMATELKGVPFPTSTQCLVRLGTTELWIGNKAQQELMHPLAENFIHHRCLDKPILTELLSDPTLQNLLKLRNFCPRLLASHLKFLFPERWVSHVMNHKLMPWVAWENSPESRSDEPDPEWIRLFWKTFWTSKGEPSLISDWPLIPAFLNRPILCRVKQYQLVFCPPITVTTVDNRVSNSSDEGSEMLNSSQSDTSQSEEVKLYRSEFELMKLRNPWLLRLLNQFNVPVYDASFLDLGAFCSIFPVPSLSLGQIVVSKLLASKQNGYLTEPTDFSSEDRDRLFDLFVSDFRPSTSYVYKREELDFLRELPIYRTVLGTYTQLHGPEQCIVSPAAFFHPNDERCLSSSAEAGLFFRTLGVRELSDQEVFLKFALPGFERKGPDEQEKILFYLYTNWKDLQSDSNIVTTLKETSFVLSANEQCKDLFKPRDLLDPTDSLLASVFSGERNKFPGERYMADGWLQILRKTGIRTSSQADVIVECARKLEVLGSQAMTHVEDPDDFEAEFSGARNEISFEIWSLAASVVDCLFANFATLYDNNFCEMIGKIAFIPAEKGFPSIGGKRGGKRILTSYRDAILLKDWPLAWSVAPILVKESFIPPEFSWGAFHLRSPPAFSTVLKHLQVVGRNNGEDSLARWPTTSGMMAVEDACVEILKYLEKVWGTLSSSDILEVQRLAFVPVANGTRLATGKSLFARLAINLSPFAFELPVLYLPFVKILKEMGMQEILSIMYAMDFLSNIQKLCGYQRLNPNEFRAVMEILNFICDGGSQKGSVGTEWVCDAIVPDDGCRLVLARSCVYMDSYGYNFIGNVDTSRLRFVHPEVAENICMPLGIKKLSDVIVEELDERLQLDVVDQIGSVPVHKIIDKLLSKSFQDAVWILMNSITNHFPSFDGQNLCQIQSSLGHVAKKLQFVRSLHTRYLLLPKYVDITRITKVSVIQEWEGSTGHRVVHFVDKTHCRILVADPPSCMSLYDVIAVVVSQVLGAPTVIPIGPLFSCPENSDKALLSLLNLGSEGGDVKSLGKHKLLVGEELLPQDALQVQFLPLRPVYSGELVAWKTLINGEKLRYGRVLEDARPSAGQALYRFSVEIAPGENQALLSSQVFSFKSVSTAEFASPSPLPERSESETQNLMQHSQTSEARGKGKLVSKNAQDLQYGRVSASELVQAVQDMLSSAGINMDAEKQSLIQTTLTLQEQLKESQVALLVEQEKADASTKEADAAKAAWVCRVCLNNEVNVTIVPCGHVLCQRCSAAVSRCPFCRAQVSKIMKIFRP